MKKLLKIDERLNRKGYFLYGLFPMVLFLLLVDSFLVGGIHPLILIFLFALLFILLLISSVKRGRDIGLRALYLLFLFGILPILILFLMTKFDYSIMVFYTVIGLSFLYLLFMPSSNKELKGLKKFESSIVFITIPILFSILLFMILPSHHHCNHDRHSLICLNMKSYAHVLEIYKEDNGNYPTTKEGTDALINHPNKYLIRKPRDAWGADILYRRTEQGFEFISYGADRKKGGEDEFKDIYYSKCEKK